jgi:hypothetical protein
VPKRTDGTKPATSAEVERLVARVDRLLERQEKESEEDRARAGLRQLFGGLAASVVILAVEFAVDPPLYRGLLQHSGVTPYPFLLKMAGAVVAVLSAASLLERYLPDALELPPLLLPAAYALLFVLSTVALLEHAWIGVAIAVFLMLNLVVTCNYLAARLLEEWRPIWSGTSAQVLTVFFRAGAAAEIALAAVLLVGAVVWLSHFVLTNLPGEVKVLFEILYLGQVLLPLGLALGFRLWLRRKARNRPG